MKIYATMLAMALVGCSSNQLMPVQIQKPILQPEPEIKNLEIVFDEPVENCVIETGDSLLIRVHVATQPDAEFVFSATLRDITGMIVSGDKGQQGKKQSAEMTLEVPVEQGIYYLEIEVDATESTGAKTHWHKTIRLLADRKKLFYCNFGQK
jgi:hypothetical protein